MTAHLPRTWSVDGGLSIGGVPLARLAERHGTPTYVVDETHVRARLAGFRAAFGRDTGLIYAGKAFLCGGLVHLLEREGWWIDVVSGGELELVRRAGFPLERTVLHGNAKTPEELRRAVSLGVGRIVVDHADELRAIAAIGEEAGRRAEVLLRLNIDVEPETHAKIRTVGRTAHFGLDLEAASALVRAWPGSPALALAGIHIHAGSQIRDLDVFRQAARAAVAFLAPIRERFADVVDLDLGGGLAVPYLAAEEAPTPDDYAAALASGLHEAGVDRGLGAHRLFVEPGRSVIANAGVTLYRVQARKRLPGLGDVVAVDGGFSDNPRPSLYGARYDVVNASRPDAARDRAFRVVGRNCETGDVIAPEVRLPADTAPGDLLVVPVTGAYGFSMSSRYNGVGRPPVVFVAGGVDRVVVRRETHDDLLACDLGVAPA